MKLTSTQWQGIIHALLALAQTYVAIKQPALVPVVTPSLAILAATFGITLQDKK